MKKIIIIAYVLFLVIYQSCSNYQSAKEIEYQFPTTFQSTSKIRYTIEGGGDINFIIENKPDSISVVVSNYNFQSRNDSLMMHKQSIDSLDLVTIEALFAGTIDIGGVIYKNNLLTGSWTYVYIEYNEGWLRTANEMIINELSSFYQLVCKQLEMI
jgi:hypothetical protein